MTANVYNQRNIEQKMQPGNLIAGLLLLPFIFVSYVIIFRPGTGSYIQNEVLIISKMLSGLAFLGGMTYLCVKNGEYISTYLHSKPLFKWLYKYQNFMRIVLLIMLFLVAFLVLISPRGVPA